MATTDLIIKSGPMEPVTQEFFNELFAPQLEQNLTKLIYVVQYPSIEHSRNEQVFVFDTLTDSIDSLNTKLLDLQCVNFSSYPKATYFLSRATPQHL